MRSFRPKAGFAVMTTLVLAAVAAASPATAAADPVPVQLVSISDFHGYLQPHSGDGSTLTAPNGTVLTVGGAAYLATHLKNIRAGKANSIFISAGDNFSGWPFEVDSHADEPTIEILNALKLDHSVVGNHELDVSRSFLVDHMRDGQCFGTIDEDSCFTDSTGQQFHGADFDFQSANITDTSGDTIVAPYKIHQVTSGGKTYPVGIIGLTEEETPVGSTSYQPDLRAKDLLESANAAAAELDSQGVKAIVLEMHEGLADATDAIYNDCKNPSGPAFDLARQVTSRIDAIVAGHWHTQINCSVNDPDGTPRPVVEPGRHGNLINEINLQLDPDSGEVLRDRTKSTNHPVTRTVTADPAVKKIVDYWKAAGERREAIPVAKITGDFTRTVDRAGESTMANLAADLHLWAAEQNPRGKADLAVISAKPGDRNTAIWTDLKKASSGTRGDAAGRVTLGESWHAYGYGNPILTVSLTGAQLDAVFEQQWRKAADGTTTFVNFAVSHNVKYYFDPRRAIGDRVNPAQMTINGAPLDLAKTYRIAVLANTAIGGGDGFTAFKVFTNPVLNGNDHETFVKYLRAKGTIAPAPLNRVYRVD